MVTDRIIPIIVSVQAKRLNTTIVLLVEGSEKLFCKVEVASKVVILDMEQSDQ